MTRFDYGFCSTFTVLVLLGAIAFMFYVPFWPERVIAALASLALINFIWAEAAAGADKHKLDAARRRFDAAAVAFMRALDNGVAGSPSRWTAEGRELLAAWNDYHKELDGTAELVRRLRR